MVRRRGPSFVGDDARKWGGKDKTFRDRIWPPPRARRKDLYGLRERVREVLLCELDIRNGGGDGENGMAR
jgi:hypothetical protein